ncbi:MAG: LysR family transcriptional regulator [Blastochloris sp.]|nr:LysR family transcriptional regulator [Blastochloris sp.]
MNVHHLELFYYVARHQGIVNACRNMPYGIQQPAVSSQLLRLEADLGVSLFRRKPFSLTPSGQRLYDFIRPFFSGLNDLESVLQGSYAQELRLAGLGEVMRDHVPAILKILHRNTPQLRVRLYERNQAQAQAALDSGEADLAVTVLEQGVPAHYETRLIAELPLILLRGPQHSRLHSLDAILRLPEEQRPPLISLPQNELLTRLFNRGLQQRQQRWPIAVEASGQDLVSHYVTQGLGIGLWVQIPRTRLPYRHQKHSPARLPQTPRRCLLARLPPPTRRPLPGRTHPPLPLPPLPSIKIKRSHRLTIKPTCIIAFPKKTP